MKLGDYLASMGFLRELDGKTPGILSDCLLGGHSYCGAFVGISMTYYIKKIRRGISLTLVA